MNPSQLQNPEGNTRSSSVFLKVGGIAPLGAKKTKGVIGEQKNTKGAKMLNH